MTDPGSDDQTPPPAQAPMPTGEDFLTTFSTQALMSEEIKSDGRPYETRQADHQDGE